MGVGMGRYGGGEKGKGKNDSMYSIQSPASTTAALGVNLLPDNSGAAFRVWAPNASAVNVLLAPADGQPMEAFSAHPGYCQPRVLVGRHQRGRGRAYL